MGRERLAGIAFLVGKVFAAPARPAIAVLGPEPRTAPAPAPAPAPLVARTAAAMAADAVDVHLPSACSASLLLFCDCFIHYDVAAREAGMVLGQASIAEAIGPVPTVFPVRSVVVSARHRPGSAPADAPGSGPCSRAQRADSVKDVGPEVPEAAGSGPRAGTLVSACRGCGRRTESVLSVRLAAADDRRDGTEARLSPHAGSECPRDEGGWAAKRESAMGGEGERERKRGRV